MRRRALKTLMILAVGIPAMVGGTQAQSPAEKAWAAFMTPGAAHSYMARFVGSWIIETRFWHAPGQPPEVSRSRADYAMILGGRYLQSRYTGTSMGPPFEGMGLEGFDNARREYISVWVDNMSTGVVVARGHLQEDARTIVYHGTRTDPLTGGEVSFRSVWESVDANRWRFEMFERQGDREVKTMAMTAVRP